MDTQNTPVHVRLWHRGFWLLAIANLLLCMAVYMLLPVLPSWLATQGFTPKGVAAVMSVYGAGMFLAGPFCGYWVQHYRRNHVCRTAILVMVASLLLFYALGRPSVAALMGGDTLRASILALRIVMGAAFGLSQMVLCSTLIIDSCESFQRTEANYAVAWFGRFALSLGPLAALVCQRFLAPDLLFLLIAGVAFVSVLLIQMVDFPFRAPDENQHMVSLDRFFLPHGWLLFLHLMCITMVAGMLLSVSHNMAFYAMLMVGFFLAVLSERGSMWSVAHHCCSFHDAPYAVRPHIAQPLCSPRIVWPGHRHHRQSFPALLHQAQPPLPARHFSEQFHTRLGTGYQHRALLGICFLPSR